MINNQDLKNAIIKGNTRKKNLCWKTIQLINDKIIYIDIH